MAEIERDEDLRRTGKRIPCYNDQVRQSPQPGILQVAHFRFCAETKDTSPIVSEENSVPSSDSRSCEYLMFCFGSIFCQSNHSGLTQQISELFELRVRVYMCSRV